MKYFALNVCLSIPYKAVIYNALILIKIYDYAERPSFINAIL